MDNKPISPATHALLDYALVGSLLILPRMLRFSPAVKRLYTAEALILFSYVAVTDQPLALKPLIPFRMHGRIDPFNVLGFALQTAYPSIRADKRATVFNTVFTALAGITVLATNWTQSPKAQ